MTILNEYDIIKIFQKKLNKKFVSEDVEIFDLNKKIKIIAKTDTMVQSTDIPYKMKLDDAARKSVIACISDFAAKGIKPQYGIISINLPKIISKSMVNDIATGFKKACNEYNITILGGDTNAGKEIVFNVCMFGVTSNTNIVKRSGAHIKDLIFVTGPFGYAAAGLNMLLDKKKINVKKNSVIKRSINAMIKPTARLKFGINSIKYFTSSMDSSDGLSTTLNTMSKQSQKKFIVNKMPVSNDLCDYAKMKKIDIKKLVFHGGEEYEIVFTALPKFEQAIIKNAKFFKTPLIKIGYVSNGNGVFTSINGENSRLRDLGWKHF